MRKPIRAMLTVAVIAAGGAMLPAHASGALYGTGFVNNGCAGGSILLQATDTGSNNWIWDVTVLCGNAAPQHVAKAGSWNASTGGVVTGFGTGLLVIEKVNCGSNGNVAVQIQMAGSPLLNGKASITRSCF